MISLLSRGARGVLAALVLVTGLGAQARLVLSDGVAHFALHPATLRVAVGRPSQGQRVVAAPVAGLGTVTALERSAAAVRWRWSGSDLAAEARLERGRLVVTLRSSTERSLAWPTLPVADARAVILPAFEGVSLRTDDQVAMAWLAGRGTQRMTEGLSLPFVGLDLGARTIACILPSPYYDEIAFVEDAGAAARITHRWTSNRLGSEHTVVFCVGKASPIGPALCYRSWLEDRGELVSLEQKIAANPAVAGLLGAPHAYVWGSDFFSHLDVPSRKWRAFAAALLDGMAAGEGFLGRFAPALSPEGKKALEEIRGLEFPHRYVKWTAARALSAALAAPDLVPRGENEARGSPAVLRRNAEAFVAALPGYCAPPAAWGNGVSTPFLDALHEAGIDRMLLCTGDLEDPFDKPQVAARARELGYLFGPYDSYHSIHDPALTGDATWATAQFDRALYESGRVVGLDGKARHGFKKRGYHLSPIAARPWVRKRVGERLARAEASAWFVDCDGYGQFFDDANEKHPATRLDDAAARRDRLRWLSEEHGLVVGSEGASAVMVPAFHFSHGVMTPVIGWGDPVFKDKASPHYMGRYWPPDGPERFFKPAPLPPKYRRPFFSPADRVPLFQAVFGDSLVATHHWGYASRKFSDQVGTNQLLEILYGVPPLHHLNRETWPKLKGAILRHFRFWSPLHKEIATRPLTAFEYLSEDRLVQRVTFAGSKGPIRITANFGRESHRTPQGLELPARSVAVDRGSRSRPAIYRAEGE